MVFSFPALLIGLLATMVALAVAIVAAYRVHTKLTGTSQEPAPS